MKKVITLFALAVLSFQAAHAQCTDLYDFSSATTSGSSPQGSLTLSGNTFYGMTEGGGANGYGTIFSIHTNGTGYKKLLDFSNANGANPYGSLVLSGNVLYGMTYTGGLNSEGAVFSIHTDGTGYKDLLDFNSLNGASPYGSLILSGNILYGMTSAGGLNSDGNIFSIDTTGTGYKDLLDFNGTNGKNPYGSLTLSGNVLYGTTTVGGANNHGVIFSVHTDGSAYKDMLDFSGTNGQAPKGSLSLLGSVLYGMTNAGGAHTDGLIFAIDTTGNNYKDLLDFNNASSPNGASPVGDLTLSGNLLYGLTSAGGTNHDGVIFSVDIAGTNYMDRFDFNGATNGSLPDGKLTLIGNLAYGLTQTGGANNKGVLFSFNTCLPVRDTIKNGVCTNDSILLGGHYRKTAGFYTDSLTTKGGCDSIRVTNLSINPLPTISFTLVTDSVCATAQALTLAGGTPTGGTYSGTGVSAGAFNPAGLTLGAYTITYTYTNGNGCTASATSNLRIVKCSNVGIATLSANAEQISIYPNPFNNVVTVTGLNTTGNSPIQVVNMLGMVVKEIATNKQAQYTLDLSALPNGVYFVKCNNSVARVVKE